MAADSHGNVLVAVGDIMLGDSAICVGYGFRSTYPRDILPAFAHVTHRLSRGEIVFGNLECLLTKRGRGNSRLQTDQMRGDPACASALRSLGFNVVSVANNHAMQHGLEGFADTVRHLNSAGIACAGLRGSDGWHCEPVRLLTRSGLRVGILSYCWRPRQYDMRTPPYAEGDPDEVERDVRRLRDDTDVVVVSLHWGEEFLQRPSATEVHNAHRIIDAGAAVLIGHHPHVLRPVERYGGGLICYSLGNFVSDMVWQDPLRRGAMLECILEPLKLLQPDIVAVRTDDSYSPRVESERAIDPSDRVVGIPDDQYPADAARSVRSQQKAAYVYALRNMVRYRLSVLATMITTTVRNKLSHIFVRSSPQRRDTAKRTPASAARKLCVLHFAAPAHFGGLESVLRELAAGSARIGQQVTVALILAPHDTQHPLVNALESRGVSVIPIHVADRSYLKERAAVRALCRRLRPDVVHTHGYRSDVVDGSVARSEGIPTVSTCHGFIDSNLRGRFFQWLQRRSLRSFDAVVAVSGAIESRLLASGISNSRIHLIPNVPASNVEFLSREDARRALGLGGGSIIGWVGRLSPEKGPDVALAAFAKMDRRDARLLFIGGGRNGADLHEKAESLGVSDRVIWHGPVQNAAALFRAFDAFLISSRTEGTPIALLEAMAAGVPIVATKVGGIPAVVDSSCALLVESENAAGIADALHQTLTDARLARTRSENATRRLSEKFSVESWLLAYEQVYMNLVAGSPKIRAVPQ